MGIGNGVTAPAFDVKRTEDLAEVLDALPTLVAYVDTDGVARYANAVVSRWLRRSPGDVVGHSLRELVGEVGYLGVAPRIAAAQAGERQEFFWSMPTADGRMTYARTEYLPRVRDGRPDGFFIMTTDVTSRVLSERVSVKQDIRSAELEHWAHRAVLVSDDVLQQLYAVGLHLDRLSRDPARATELTDAVLAGIQDTINRLRSSITGMVGGDSPTADVARQLVRSWSERVGAQPMVVLDARLDELPAAEAHHVLSALSEILGTAAWHDAGPLRVEVAVEDDGPVVRVEGEGWSQVARSEFGRMSTLEREDGGRLEVDARHPVVTRVAWSAAPPTRPSGPPAGGDGRPLRTSRDR